MVKIKHVITWENSYVVVKNNEGTATIEISYNRFTRNYKFCTAHKENVKFTGDLNHDILLMQALDAAIQYIKEQRND